MRDETFGSPIYNTLQEPDHAACYLCRVNVPHSIAEHRVAVKEGLHNKKYRGGRFDWSKPEDRAAYHKEEREKAAARYYWNNV